MKFTLATFLSYSKGIARFKSKEKEFLITATPENFKYAIEKSSSVICTDMARVMRLLELHQCQFFIMDDDFISTVHINNLAWQLFLRDLSVLSVNLDELCEEFVDSAKAERDKLLLQLGRNAE